MVICADFLEDDISFPARFASVEQSFSTKFEGTVLVQGPPGPAGPQGKTGASCYVRINPETMMWETATVSEGEEAIWISSGIVAVGPAGITPHIGANGNWFVGETDTGKPSRGADGVPGKPGATGPVGPQGPAGAPGTNGTSVRHWWDGTVLYIASASGTSSADLRGPAGEGGTADVAPLFVGVTADMVIDCPVSDINDAVMASRSVYLIGYDQNGRYMLGLGVGIVDNSFVFTPYISGDGQFLVYSVDISTGAVSMLDAAAVFGEQFSSVIYEALAQAKASGEFDGADGITPHIGANGNWFIGDTDTGKPSRGADGKTAYQYAKDGGYTGSESDFALKIAKECPTKLSELTNDKGYITSGEAPVQSVNGETGAVHLTASDVGARSASWMPTAAQVGAVPVERTVNGKALSGDIALNAEDVGARSNTWTPTYTDVGAEKSGTAASAVTAHNSKEDAHNDIRLLIAALTTRLDALANSDDTTLDQMAEVVAYIKDNRGLIEQITTGKVSVSDIVNNLTTNVANKPLSAAQGVALKALIDAITVPTKLSQLTNDKGYITGYTETDPTVPAWAKEPNKPSYDKSEVGLGKVDNVKQYSASNPPPYPVTSVNGNTGAVTLDAAAVGARPDTWMPSAADVGALTESALGGAVNNALEQAKASGAFDGATGQRGTGLLAITTAPSSYTTEVNGITPTYRIALDTVKSQAGVDEVLVGDTLRYSYYHYPIIYVDASYVYCRARVNIRGATGADGATPEKGTDYFTPADKNEMVNSVLAALPTWTGGSY